ncbi:MAG: glycosyltransferase family 4 protein [Pseudomonadota bacterium]
MVSISDLIALVGAFLSSLLLLALVLRFAVRLGLVAAPNERSSHSDERPTGGGVAIVVPVFSALLWLFFDGTSYAGGVAIACGGLALIGYLDDVRDLGAGLRFGCQLLAVVIALWALALGYPWWVLAAIGFLLLWHVNLYNFMDGIDGIAAVQTLVFCLGVQALGAGLPGAPGLLLWAMTGATLGFTAYNWPPARIFMGDVGSLFLGLLIGVLAIQLHELGQVPIVASLILLTGFWFDASYTLGIRLLSGQKFTQAHRSHLYQRVTDRLGHKGTTLLFGAMAVCYLLPLAWASMRFSGWAYACLAIAVLPYLLGAIHFKAGRLLPESA